MNDLSQTIAPKSDQMNADDLIAGPRTIRITKVSVDVGGEQPVALNFEGDNGKPFRPCKSMRRVLVALWGADGAQYAGRSMTLYRDDSVQFGGLAVGGIRISHMSDIDAEKTLVLTATKKSRKPFTVRRLDVAAQKPRWQTRMDEMLADVVAVENGQQMMAVIDKHRTARDWFKENRPAESATIEKNFAEAYQRHMAPAEADLP